MKQSNQLTAALQNRSLVQFTRPFEEGSVLGYVLDIGTRFLLVAIVEHSCRFNGFGCFRLSDVRQLEVPHRYSAFVEAALKKRRFRIPKKPAVNVADIKDALITASHAFPLVTIHRERLNPDVCQIGHVVDVANDRLTLLEIGPDTSWDEEPGEYRLRDITRIDFGGDYEQALHLVGGPPPKKALKASRLGRR